MIVYEIPGGQHCPRCFKLLELTGQITPEPQQTPQPGDFSVCLRCGGVLVFEAGYRLRMPTPEEIRIFRDRWKRVASLDTSKRSIMDP